MSTEKQRQQNISDAAKRALQEAEARRDTIDAKAKDLPKEIKGRRKGLEPVRYDDWEKGGIAIDF